MYNSLFIEAIPVCPQPSRTQITCLQFEQDGDVVTADSDGFVTVYSVDSDGAYFVRMEFEVDSEIEIANIYLRFSCTRRKFGINQTKNTLPQFIISILLFNFLRCPLSIMLLTCKITNLSVFSVSL